MSSKAVTLWQSCLQKLAEAIDAANPADASAAAAAVVTVVKQLQDEAPLPSAAFKQLVEDAQVLPLVVKAFNDSAHKQPLSSVTAAATCALGQFLMQAKAAGALGSRHPSNAHQRGSSSSSNSSPHPSNLAAAVRTHLQDSGLQQQLALTMEAVAQQLEAEAAEPAVLAAWWHAEESPLLSSTGHTHVMEVLNLLSILSTLLYTAPNEDDALRWVLHGTGAAAAHLGMSALRLVSALVQQQGLLQGEQQGNQLILPFGRDADDPVLPRLFSQVLAVCHCAIQMQLAVFGTPDDRGYASCTVPAELATTHVFELVIACTTAHALRLQHTCSQPAETPGYGGGSSSGSSTVHSAASNQGGSTDASSSSSSRSRSIVRAWSQAHQQAASLTPLQQELFSQLGVDARVLLWGVWTASAADCVQFSTLGLDVEATILGSWIDAGWCWPQQTTDSLQQQPQQQQPQQQQPQQPADAGSLPPELQLHLLLQCVTLPCCRAALCSSSSTDLTTDLVDDYMPHILHSVAVLPVGFAASAAGSQASFIHAWLEDVLQSLLLLSAHFTRGQQQLSSGNSASAVPGARSSIGSSSSSSSHPVAEHTSSSSSMADNSPAGLRPHNLGDPAAVRPEATAAALCVMAALDDLITIVCTPEGNCAADTECRQSTYEAPLQRRTTAILAQFDSCVRAAHRCAAAGVLTAGGFLEVPKTLSSQAMAACLRLLCDSVSCSSGPLFALVLWAQQAGPGSQEQRQLYSLLASLLKLCGDKGVMLGDVEQLKLSRRCRYGAAEAAAVLLLDGVASSSPAATGTVAVQNEQPAQRPAVHALLPSLVIFGRACLQWALELQLPVDTALQQTAAAGTRLDEFSALSVYCVSFSSPTEHAVGSISTDSITTRLTFITGHFHAWLSKHTTTQPAGYDPHSLMQQLELLKQAAAEAAAAGAAAAGQQPMTQVLQSLVHQLQVVGTALSSLAVQAFCNNPSCSNLSGPTEVQLVSGRSCICAGCLTARFCSRACLKQHWKVHKPVCKALAAAAVEAKVAGAEGANAGPAGVGGG